MLLNIRFRNWCLLALSLLLIGLQPFAAHAEDQDWTQRFQQQIHNWVHELVNKDKEFSDWKDASIQMQSLGPNSRQWLVTLSKAGKSVGYLVVGETPVQPNGKPAKPSFVLLEYGTGEFVLFDDAFAPKHVAAEPVYDGFASYWLIATHDSAEYVDAKTGERYPSVTRPDAPVMPTLRSDELAGAQQHLGGLYTLSAEPGDPFDRVDWLTAKPMETGKQDRTAWKRLCQASQTTPVVITASLFQDEVMAPFSVGAVHVWGDDVAYIGVWDEGLRFLPYAYVNKVAKLIFRESSNPHT